MPKPNRKPSLPKRPEPDILLTDNPAQQRQLMSVTTDRPIPQFGHYYEADTRQGFTLDMSPCGRFLRVSKAGKYLCTLNMDRVVSFVE